MALTDKQQTNVKKFFLNVLLEAISEKKNIKQSIITDEQASSIVTQLQLSNADAKRLLNAYKIATTSTKIMAQKDALNFIEVKEFLSNYQQTVLTPCLIQALQAVNQPTETTPLSITNARDAKINLIISTIKQLDADLAGDNFHEKYKEELQQAKKALYVTGITLGIAAVVGLTIFAGIKIFGVNDNIAPSSAPSPF